jgi:hypothetical protein
MPFEAAFATHFKGISIVRNIAFKVTHFIEANRAFSSLPYEIKDAYAPDRSQGGTFIGYEKGK